MDENIDNVSNSDKNGFFNTVFNFDEENRGEMMNIIQYTILAIIPCLLILKACKYIFPGEDESKGSIEIFIEAFLQISFILIALTLIDKMVKYIPTYSKIPYLGNTPFPTFSLPFIFLLLTMQTKVAGKVNILLERCIELIQGKKEALTVENNNNNNVSVHQPLAGGHSISRADTLDQSQLLPNSSVNTQLPAMQNPDFNDMYQNQTTPMPGAATPGMSEPVPANDGGGGFGGFSSW